jgi:hypothetical protein
MATIVQYTWPVPSLLGHDPNLLDLPSPPLPYCHKLDTRQPQTT